MLAKYRYLKNIKKVISCHYSIFKTLARRFHSPYLDNKTVMKNHFLTDAGAGRLVNKELTHRLMKLHADGYHLDFCMTCNEYLTCVQNQERFPCENIIIKVVDQVYDFLTNSFKYVHTVDTACGCKGIMLIEGIYGLYIRPDVMQLTVRQHGYNREDFRQKLRNIESIVV